MRRARGMGNVGRRGPRGKGRQSAPARASREGAEGTLTLVLVRLALALARRVGLTASAIDPTASPSPFVFVKTLRFPQPAQSRPPDCHMIECLRLLEGRRPLGVSTGCSVGQTFSLSDGISAPPPPLPSGPALWSDSGGSLAPPEGTIPPVCTGRGSDAPG